MGKIKLLSDEIINQIAAGEIVERPSSALKEIVENAIDAHGKNIDIFLKSGGKTKIVVEDDGDGLSKEDLSMAIQRHATSKLSGSNLFEINSYGFRGEALPSIASVSNFSIESNGFGISINFSKTSEIYPSNISKGTRVTIENLFDKTPARLKFLKSDSVELSNCISVIENFSLTKKDVNFNLGSENGSILSFKNISLDNRISSIFGAELFKKAVHFEESDGTISIKGYLFHPMDSKYSQGFQKIFINGRIVKDKTVSASIKNAYRDLIPTGRFAACVIFIEIDPFYVDVNVSPTKSEIRFRDSGYVQKFLTESIKKNLTKFDRVVIDFNIEKFSNIGSNVEKKEPFQNQKISEVFKNYQPLQRPSSFLINTVSEKPSFRDTPEIVENYVEQPQPILKSEIYPEQKFFGEPICQIFDTYIITKTENGIMIIDQHAVHEKITMEKMIEELNTKNKQFLMKPEIIKLTTQQLEIAKLAKENLENCGFSIEIIQESIVISGIPAILDNDTAIQFVEDILESSSDIIEDLETIDKIRNKIADKACHNSIRSGRKLSQNEMVGIIDDMEKTKSIHQCNHHRPSFVMLSKDQLESMFERS